MFSPVWRTASSEHSLDHSFPAFHPCHQWLEESVTTDFTDATDRIAVLAFEKRIALLPLLQQFNEFSNVTVQRFDISSDRIDFATV